jgi:hypothetical protein
VPFIDGRLKLYAPNAFGQPPLSQRNESEVNDSDQVKEDDDVNVDQGYDNEGEDMEDDGDESEREDEIHDNDISDMEAQDIEENFDHDIPYQYAYAYKSEDDGPENDLDEGGLIEEEAQIFTKVIGWDHQISLFRDLCLAHKAIVDGGMSKAIEPRPYLTKCTTKKSNKFHNAYLLDGLKFPDLEVYKISLTFPSSKLQSSHTN